MRKNTAEVRAPLLDRLVDEAPLHSTETVPKRALTRRQYRESVRRDLVWLLNTRTPVPAAFSGAEALSVTEFGLPDFGRLFSADRRDWGRLSRAVEKALASFEPRLKNPAVEVREAPGDIRRLRVHIVGTLVADGHREPFSFPLVYDLEQGEFGGEEAHD
jgi:type VI secretion system protein ImpF